MQSVVLRFAGCGRRIPDERTADNGFHIVQRWGIAVKPVRDLPQFDPGKPVGGILDTPGEWWALCRDDSGRYLILTDPFSLQPVFYAAVWTPHGSDLLIGPRVDATAQAIGTLGAKVETDWAGVLPSLLTNHDFFDTAHDVLTPVRRLLISRPDQAILVEDGGFKMVSRPSLGNSSASYEDLLQAGINRATQEIGATLTASGSDRAVINLSGGKDSRLVLALINAGGFQSNLQVHAVDPRGSHPAWRSRILMSDLEISSRLLTRYGLTWAQGPSAREVWPTTLDSQLFTFQHHRGGRSYQFFANARSYSFVPPAVRFTGAGAGSLKSPWATEWQEKKFWNSMGRSADTLRSDALQVYRGVGGPARLPVEIHKRAVNRFVTTMRDLSTDGTIDTAVAAHYRTFRNRGHVGGLAWGRSMGVINSKPLLQPEFLAASQLLPPEERDAGRMIFDLFELLDPTLNELEFQSGAWPWELGRPWHADWSRYPADISRYFVSRDGATSSSPSPVIPGPSRPDMLPLMRRGLDQLHQSLDDAKLPATAILRRYQENPPTDRRTQGRLLAKLATWAHSMPDPGMFAGSANPLAPRVVSMTPDKTASAIP